MGTRIELVPMDRNFHDITVALYRRHADDGTCRFVVHSYSRLPGAAARIDAITATLSVLAGLHSAASGGLAFPCGQDHEAAVCHAFVEACRHDPDADPAASELETVDRRSGLTLRAAAVGDGQYRVIAEGEAEAESAARRVDTVVNGLLKLGDMRRVDIGAGDCVAFPCGHDHDSLVGLLLRRAPNVRALAREREMMAARGVLAAPSGPAVPS